MGPLEPDTLHYFPYPTAGKPNGLGWTTAIVEVAHNPQVPAVDEALLVTGTGGIALLVGFLLLGTIAGTYEISRLSQQSVVIQENSLYLAVLLLGCGCEGAGASSEAGPPASTVQGGRHARPAAPTPCRC